MRIPLWRRLIDRWFAGSQPRRRALDRRTWLEELERRDAPSSLAPGPDCHQM